MFEVGKKFKIKDDYISVVGNVTKDKAYEVYKVSKGIEGSHNWIHFKNDIDETSIAMEIYCELIVKSLL